MSSGNELFDPGTRRPIQSPKLLVVEGRDTFRCFLALLKHLGLDTQIEVRNGGGIPAFHDYFQDLVLISGFSSVTSLGIVRDCETDPAVAFQQTCAGLLRAGLPVPAVPEQATTAPPDPKVNLLLLPSSNEPGMLESLLWNALAGDPRIACVDEYLECVQRHIGKPLKREAKSRIHAFIAGNDEPYYQIGQAAMAGYFPWASPVFDPVKQFLYSL